MRLSDQGPPIGHLAQIGSVGVYSVGLLGQKQLAGEIPFPMIAFWQFAVAAALLWALSLAIAPGRRLRPAHVAVGLLWGVLAPGLSLMINMVGAQHTDGVTMMLIWGLLPMVAPLLSPVLIGERFRPIMIVAAAIAIGGAWLGVDQRAAQGWASVQGAALVATAVLMAGSGFVLGRWLNRSKGPWHRFAALQVSGAAIVALAVAMAGPGISTLPFATLQSGAIMAYLIVGMTVLNFLLFNFALARIPVAWASIYTALNAPLGALAAFALLGDPLRGRDIAMIAVVTLSVALPHYVEGQARRRARGAGAAEPPTAGP